MNILKIFYRLLFVSLLVVLLGANGSAKKSKKKKKKFRYDVIVMNRKSESRKKTDIRPVIFTHLSHMRKYTCKICHPAIFSKRRGANDITMYNNAKGKFCGKCHNGRAAWSLLECDICHSGDPIADENAVRYAE